MAVIEVIQHRGKTPSGKTVAHPMDDVFWNDGPHRRKVAVRGHEKDAPLIWIQSGIPEDIVNKVLAAVEKRKQEQDATTKRAERAAPPTAEA